jgi:adhesin/invasin
MLPEWSPSRIAEGAPSRPFATSRRFTTRRALTSLGLGLIALWACDDLVVDDRTLEIGTTGTVEGSVFLDVDGSGTQTTVDQPAPGIRVRIVRAGQGSAVASAESDSAGTFRMDSVPVGEFLLNVDSASVPDSVRVVELDTTPFVIMPGETVRRDVRLSFPEYTLAEVRELETGLRVFTHGIALNTRFSFGDGIVHLREGDVHLRVTEVARGSVTPQPQDSVRVLGRTAREAGRPILTDARLFVLQPEAVPPLVPEYVSTGTAATADDARLDAALVEIREARILDTIPEGPDLIVTVDDGSAPVEVRIRGFLEFDRASLEPGTRQLREATGLLEAVQDEAGSVRWRLLLRTADDAAVDEYAPPDISASGSTVAAEPDTVVADGDEGAAVTVVLRTSAGGVIDEPRSVTLSVTTGPGELSTATPDFDPGSNSYTAALTSTAAGTAVVAAAADGVALTQQPLVEFVAGPAASLDVTGGQGQSGGTGAPLGDSLEVRVADAFGNPVAGALVTWTPATGSGSADPAASETGDAGLARTSWILGTDAGEQTLTATAEGVEEGVTFAAAALAGAVSASVSSVSAEPASGITANGVDASTVSVGLRDAEGNEIAGLGSGAFSVALESGSGAAAGGPVTETGTPGTYTFEVTNTAADDVTVVVTAAGVELDDRPVIGFVPGEVSAEHSTIEADADTLTADGASSGTLTVTLRDGEGNLIPVQRTVTLAVVEGPGTLSTASPAFDPGSSTYTAMITSTLSGRARIAATVAAAPEDITLDQVAEIEFVAGAISASESRVTADPESLVANGADASTVTVELRDEFQNPVTGVAPGLFTVSAPGDASLTGIQETATPGSYGLEMTNTTAQSVTVTVTADGVTLDDQPVILFIPGPIDAGSSQVTADPSSATADGETASAITVRLRDAQENVIGEAFPVAIRMSSGPSGVVIDPTEPLFSGADSTYTAEIRSTETGTATILVTADGIELRARPTVQFTVGDVDGAQSEATAEPATRVADGVEASTITVILRDAEGNLIEAPRPLLLRTLEEIGTFAETEPAFDPATNSYTTTFTSTQAGTATVEAVADGQIIVPAPQVEFVPGPASQLEFTNATTDLTAGTTRTLTVEVQDAFGNLVTGDAGRTVTFAQTAGDGTVTGLGTATTAGGIAELDVTGEEAGAVTIGATATGLTSSSTSFTVTVGAASQLVFTSSEAALASGATRTLTAEVRDGAGNLVTGDAGRTVTFAQTAGDGTVTGLGTATTAGGIAELEVTGEEAGAVTIGATATGLTSSSTSFTVTVGAASQLVFTSSEAALASGATRTLTAEVRDGAGNLVTGDAGRTVTFAQTAGDGTVTGLGTATTTGGIAELEVTGEEAGAVTIGATATGLTSSSTSFTVTVGAASQLVFTSSEAALASGATRTLTAEVRDGAGNLVTGDAGRTVTFAQTAGDGTVTGLGTATTAGGIAELDVTGEEAGAVTIGATATGLTSSTTTFTVTVGAASQLVFTSSEAALASGATRTLTAEVRDGAGNLVTGDAGRTVTFAQTAGDGTVTGLGTATTAGGIAELEVTGEEAGSVTIGATATGLTSSTTTFTVTVGAASQLVFTSSEAALASGTTRTLTAEVRDGAGNLVTGDAGRIVTFAQTTGDGTVTGLGTATTTGGIAELDVTGEEAGAVTIGATAPDLTAGTTTFTVSVGAASQLVFTSSEAALASGATRTLRAEVRDGAGNLVTTDEDRTVTFAQTAGDGTVTGLGTATTAGGIAELEVTGEEAGAVTIEATAPDLTAGTTTFTVTVGG